MATLQEQYNYLQEQKATVAREKQKIIDARSQLNTLPAKRVQFTPRKTRVAQQVYKTSAEAQISQASQDLAGYETQILTSEAEVSNIMREESEWRSVIKMFNKGMRYWQFLEGGERTKMKLMVDYYAKIKAGYSPDSSRIPPEAAQALNMASQDYVKKYEGQFGYKPLEMLDLSPFDKNIYVDQKIWERAHPGQEYKMSTEMIKQILDTDKQAYTNYITELNKQKLNPVFGDKQTAFGEPEITGVSSQSSRDLTDYEKLDVKLGGYLPKGITPLEIKQAIDKDLFTDSNRLTFIDDKYSMKNEPTVWEISNQIESEKRYDNFTNELNVIKSKNLKPQEFLKQAKELQIKYGYIEEIPTTSTAKVLDNKFNWGFKPGGALSGVPYIGVGIPTVGGFGYGVNPEYAKVAKEHVVDKFTPATINFLDKTSIAAETMWTNFFPPARWKQVVPESYLWGDVKDDVITKGVLNKFVRLEPLERVKAIADLDANIFYQDRLPYTPGAGDTLGATASWLNYAFSPVVAYESTKLSFDYNKLITSNEYKNSIKKLNELVDQRNSGKLTEEEFNLKYKSITSNSTWKKIESYGKMTSFQKEFGGYIDRTKPFSATALKGVVGFTPAFGEVAGFSVGPVRVLQATRLAASGSTKYLQAETTTEKVLAGAEIALAGVLVGSRYIKLPTSTKVVGKSSTLWQGAKVAGKGLLGTGIFAGEAISTYQTTGDITMSLSSGLGGLSGLYFPGALTYAKEKFRPIKEYIKVPKARIRFDTLSKNRISTLSTETGEMTKTYQPGTSGKTSIESFYRPSYSTTAWEESSGAKIPVWYSKWQLDLKKLIDKLSKIINLSNIYIPKPANVGGIFGL